ncbi:PH domain-containing protein [Ornithobacterium rhinotracheale]
MNLTSGEVLNNYVYKTKAHWISYYLYAIISLVSMPFVFLLIYSVFSQTIPEFFHSAKNAVFIFFSYVFFSSILNLVRVLRVKIYINKKHLTLQTGILSMNLNDISLKKIEAVQLYQSFWGRIFKYGTLSITTGGATQSYKIENPEEFRKHLLSISENLN